MSSLAATGPAAARVGETQPELEAHLLANASAKKLSETLTLLMKYMPPDQVGGKGSRRGGGGIIYVREGFDFQPIDNLVKQAAGQDPDSDDSDASSPSGEFTMHHYFKSDDGSSAQVDLQKDHSLISGWELQAYEYKGVGVLEIYRRINRPLTDPEIALILVANGASSKWKVASVQPSTWEQKGDSFLGYDYVRDDGQVRALRKGNDLVVFSAGFDKRLVDLMDKARNVQNAGTKGTAPTSVKGF